MKQLLDSGANIDIKDSVSDIAIQKYAIVFYLFVLYVEVYYIYEQ